MNADVETSYSNDRISVNLTHSLDPELYDHPLTLKTYVPEEWTTVSVQQGDSVNRPEVMTDNIGTYIMYDALPNAETVELSSADAN
jgi:hypothetical protein